MTKRKLSRRQAWRIEKIQQERAARAAKKEASLEQELDAGDDEGDLGPEQKGLVTAHYGTQVLVEATQSSETKRCYLRANLGTLVTGDRVIWRDGGNQGVVVAVLPRQSALTRLDAYQQTKTIAANIDQLIIVLAPFPKPYSNLVDRYLVASESLSLKPLILLNKIDLLDDSNRGEMTHLLNTYRSLGYQTMAISTKHNQNIDQLKRALAGHTSVFVGQSGVGKSSLINALLPDANTKVGPLSSGKMKGTHTTTSAQLFHFPEGGDLIDSPGIREFGLWSMSADELLAGFVEFRPYLGLCKFRNCRHWEEPDCAVIGAVESGKVNPERLKSYRQILTAMEENKGNTYEY